MRVFSALALAAVVAGCTGTPSPHNANETLQLSEQKKPQDSVVGKLARAIGLEKDETHISNKTKFSQRTYQVAASPRISDAKRPRKGGGRYQVGKPYKIKGRWYTPTENPKAKEIGIASWYGPNFHGRLTANGEIYDQYSLSAAHPTMPLPSYARVTNLENGHSVMVRVNDRGPFSPGRVIDLSAHAAKLLDFRHQGVAKVKVEYKGKAQMDGLDEPKLLASYRVPGGSPDALPNNTMLALADVQPATNPSAAIGSAFASGDGAALQRVPVPIERPTLFDGIPLADGTVAIRAKPDTENAISGTYLTGYLPMGEGGEATSFDAYHGIAPKTPVVLHLGSIANEYTADLLKDYFALHGFDVSINDDGLASIATVEARANAALRLARDAGIGQARIR